MTEPTVLKSKDPEAVKRLNHVLLEEHFHNEHEGIEIDLNDPKMAHLVKCVIYQAAPRMLFESLKRGDQIEITKAVYTIHGFSIIANGISMTLSAETLCAIRVSTEQPSLKHLPQSKA